MKIDRDFEVIEQPKYKSNISVILLLYRTKPKITGVNNQIPILWVTELSVLVWVFTLKINKMQK